MLDNCVRIFDCRMLLVKNSLVLKPFSYAIFDHLPFLDWYKSKANKGSPGNLRSTNLTTSSSTQRQHLKTLMHFMPNLVKSPNFQNKITRGIIWLVCLFRSRILSCFSYELGFVFHNYLPEEITLIRK